MKRTREALDRVRRMIDVGLVTREKSCERKERFSSLASPRRNRICTSRHPGLNDARHAVKHVEHRTGVSKLRHGEEAAA